MELVAETKKEIVNLLYLNAGHVNAFLIYFPSPFGSTQVVGILHGHASMGHQMTADPEVNESRTY